MSVEDARADLVQRIIADRPWVPALDRLILEVRAEMPCYWRWNEEDEIEPDCPTLAVIVPWCPSCLARQQLTAVLH